MLFSEKIEKRDMNFRLRLLTLALKCAWGRSARHSAVYKIKIRLDGLKRIANNKDAFAMELFKRLVSISLRKSDEISIQRKIVSFLKQRTVAVDRYFVFTVCCIYMKK